MNLSDPPALKRVAPAGISRRAMLAGGLAVGLGGSGRAFGRTRPAGWDEILRDGRSQPVFFYARGDDERTNAFITWAGGRVRALYGIELRQVELRDTAEAVASVDADKTAGKTAGGAIDLVWIGGADLAAMRERGLLDGPVLDLLPAARLIARVDKPVTMMDRGVRLDGYAVPWRLAQIVFIHDTASNPDPPRTTSALLDWAQRHPGRLTHLNLRDPLGVAFLEQALCELVREPALLSHPVSAAGFAQAGAPLWQWYDRLRPTLWQGGTLFPASMALQRALMKQGKIDLMISFNPSEAVTGIAAGTLPATARAYVPERGSIGHCSFVAVPFNATQRAGALLVADFLLSPEAQARDSDPRFVGVPSVLAMDALSPEDYRFFDAVPRLPDLLSDAERGLPLPESHVSWVNQMIAGWEQRYGV